MKRLAMALMCLGIVLSGCSVNDDSGVAGQLSDTETSSNEVVTDTSDLRDVYIVEPTSATGQIAYAGESETTSDLISRVSPDYSEIRQYESDLDHDGADEIICCLQGPKGTGVSIERLVVFDDPDDTGRLTPYEFTTDMQLEQIENRFRFVPDIDGHTLEVYKDDVLVDTMDWEQYADLLKDDEIGIDCLNQVSFGVSDNGITMSMDIGLWFDLGGPPIFLENGEGELQFDIIYSDGAFELK